MLDRQRHSTVLPESEAVVLEASVADRNAVARLRGGDVQALDGLYHQHAGVLLQLATRLLGSRENAEDVVHDVFVAIVAAASTLRDDSDVGAWLRTLTINRCIDRNRALARRDALSIRLVASTTTSNDDADIVAADRIEEAIAALPRAIRAVFVLRAIEGHTHVDIARLLGIRVGTSEVRYYRAVRALRVALGDLR
jgi:RNA polymerase sigma-70 factor (ECF subfamily)